MVFPYPVSGMQYTR